MNDQPQCLVGEQWTEKHHDASPDDSGKIQLQGWHHTSHSGSWICRRLLWWMLQTEIYIWCTARMCNPIVLQDAYHDFCCRCIKKKTHQLDQSDQDIERLLQPNWVLRSNKLAVDMNATSCCTTWSPIPSCAVASSRVWQSHSLTTSSPHTPLDVERLLVIPPGMAHQFCSLPETFLEAYRLWPNSIGRHNIECSLPIKRVIW